jgi:predicted ATP-grasp superfamily ATP-dependent carboligase
MQRLDRVPVLLLGGVSLVRALGLAGIPAVVASYESDEPAFASRYCVGRCVLPPLENEAAIDAIVTIGDRLTAMYGRRVPLMYGNDDYLKLIYAHRERLQRYFLLMLNEPEVAQALLLKDAFQTFAQRRGLPVPPSLEWDGTGPGTVAGTAEPVVVKPCDKDGWHDSTLKKRLFGDAKALVFDSGAKAAANPDVAMFRDQLTVQRYIEGDDTCIWSYHAFADENGAVLDSFIGRKLRTFPANTGESSFIELDENEELAALGADIAARLPLKGIFKMDFKKDARTGRWYLLEINARFNLWHYLGACSGVNLLRVAYEYTLDGTRPLEPRRYGTGLRWMSFELDLRAFLELRARKALGTLGWLGSIVFSRKVYNLFAWRDPGPWLGFWARRINRQWRSTAS